MNETNQLSLQVVDDKPKQMLMVDNQTSALLAMAIDKDLDISKLEKLIDLKNAEESRFAKREFDKNFAAMQSDYKPVARQKSVKNKENTKTIYNYAPLEDILKVYQPIISSHGFSYRWKEESIMEGREKRITCIVSGWGHSESVHVDIPIVEATSFTNSAQQRGSSSSYGKRYSFCAAFGVIIEDEDDDGQALTFDNAVKFPFITEALTTATKETLAIEFKKIWEANSDNPDARSIRVAAQGQAQKGTILVSDLVQHSPEWHQYKIGKIGASRLQDILAEPKSGPGPSASWRNYMAELCVERITGKQSTHFSSKSMDYGTETEPLARSEYEARMGVLVMEVGFIDHPTIPNCGASPDGLVGDRGGFETKCPNTATHIDRLFGAKLEAGYYAQAQWNIECTQRDWWDWVSFDPDLPENCRFLCKRIERDEAFLAKARAKVWEFQSDLEDMIAKLRAYNA